MAEEKLSQEEFFELLRETVQMSKFPFTPAKEWTRHTRVVGNDTGESGSWTSYDHPTRKGWLIVEKTPRDRYNGHLYGSDRRFFATDDTCYRD